MLCFHFYLSEVFSNFPVTSALIHLLINSALYNFHLIVDFLVFLELLIFNFYFLVIRKDTLYNFNFLEFVKICALTCGLS